MKMEVLALYTAEVAKTAEKNMAFLFKGPLCVLCGKIRP
jgi:hypothetical protein